MIEFFGWEMPVEFSGVIDEHLAVRQKAGLSVGVEDMVNAFDVVNPHLERMIEAQTIKFSDSVQKTIGNKLDTTTTAIREELVKQGVRGPNTLKALEEGVRHVYEGVSKYKARQIAITESSRAVNDANIMAAAQSNVAAMIGKAAFLAPPMRTLPRRRGPPLIWKYASPTMISLRPATLVGRRDGERVLHVRVPGHLNTSRYHARPFRPAGSARRPPGCTPSPSASGRSVPDVAGPR